MEHTNKTIALLIDAENISQKYFEILIEELNKFGDITYKRIYGDFTKSNLGKWRDCLLEYAIEPMQQYSRVAGKNATDSAIIIDAMDILYKGTVNCVCLATSDSDFTKLATRFRNENIFVIGAGEKKTPSSFRVACHRFLLMDELLAESKEEAEQLALLPQATKVPNGSSTATKTMPKQGTSNSRGNDSDSIAGSSTNVVQSNIASSNNINRIVQIAINIINDESDSDGWMNFSDFMRALYKKENSFNPKHYGHSNSKPISFFKDIKVGGRTSFVLGRNESCDIIKSSVEHKGGGQII